MPLPLSGPASVRSGASEEGDNLASSVPPLERYEHLLEPGELAEQGPAEAVRLPLDLIDANPNNPRGVLPEVDLLADNIRTFGLLQPVIVRRAGDRYELLGGHRRMAAFLLLRDVRDPLAVQWRTIPAVVVGADDDRAFLMLLSVQIHHSDWKPREEASALERLIVNGRSLKQIGEILNRDESWASKRLRVYSDSVLSGPVQAGVLGRSVAEELLTVLDPQTKQDLAKRAVAEGWSQDKARGAVRALRLDRQLAEVARRAHELLELLSVIQVDQLPYGAMEELNLLRRRIQRLAMGGPVIPSIAQAEKAAGVNPNAKPRRQQKRRRTMPAPS